MCGPLRLQPVAFLLEKRQRICKMASKESFLAQIKVEAALVTCTFIAKRLVERLEAFEKMEDWTSHYEATVEYFDYLQWHLDASLLARQQTIDRQKALGGGLAAMLERRLEEQR